MSDPACPEEPQWLFTCERCGEELGRVAFTRVATAKNKIRQPCKRCVSQQILASAEAPTGKGAPDG